MKTALITTTINVPRVLALYRKFGPDVAFFVAADEKTPLEAYQFCADIPDCEIYSPDRQRELGYECSALLGWNNDSRRNIALLEAVKHGAELILSIDDDMLPLGENFFAQIDALFAKPYSGIEMGSRGTWFDHGKFTTPPFRARGLPVGYASPHVVAVADSVEIGAAQGVILGVPDTDAMTQCIGSPLVTGATDILRHGFVVDPYAHAVFNSQLTVFRRELVPCFAQFYNWMGRNTDIVASVIMRRVMREMTFATYYGPPFAFHARNQHDTFKDLQAEMFGLAHIAALANFLDECDLTGRSVVQNLRLIYSAISDGLGPLPKHDPDAALAFLDDVEKVL